MSELLLRGKSAMKKAPCIDTGSGHCVCEQAVLFAQKLVPALGVYLFQVPHANGTIPTCSSYHVGCRGVCSGGHSQAMHHGRVAHLGF